MTSILVQWLFAILSVALPGCEGRYEDEADMYWNAATCGASTEGHGRGDSFVSVEFPADQVLVIYADGSHKVIS